MWIAFNSNGIVERQLNYGSPARQGCSGSFNIFVYFDGTDVSESDIVTMSLQRPDGTNLETTYFMDYIPLEDNIFNINEISSVRDRNGDTSPFINGMGYKGFRFTPNDPAILGMAGQYRATVKLYKNNYVMLNGTIDFNVEPTVYNDEYNISATQWDELLKILPAIGGGRTFIIVNDIDQETLESLQISDGQIVLNTNDRQYYLVHLTNQVYSTERYVLNATLNMLSVTYEQLVTLRDDSLLIPGVYYRITDYITTTALTDTSSAGHQFDVIVRADDVNVLNENARACLHDGDTYFANNDLSAWKLKYCIDNDITRFAWADSTNGKGVIFWLKDEFNNECPYDFKNILFTKADVYTNAYTFTYIKNVFESKDASIFGISKGCYNNVIKEYYVFGKLQLNWNIFYLSTPNPIFNCYSNTFGNNCHDNTFAGNYCYSNAFGNNCYDNTFGSSCSFNAFGNNCYDNTFGNNCSYNTFGAGYYHNTFDFSCERNTFGTLCSYNTFGAGCQCNTFGTLCSSNTFGNQCSYNTFGNYCHSNTFGINCSSNTFGNYCYSNTFDNECPYNTFGNHCYSNTFGNNCYSNTFDNECYRNTFGIYCSYNTFGNNCSYNTFGTSSSAINYCRHIIFDNGCSYIYLSSADTTASRSNRLQNVHIHLGVMGSSNQNRLSIVVPDRALTYSIDYYAGDSQNIILDD